MEVLVFIFLEEMGVIVAITQKREMEETGDQDFIPLAIIVGIQNINNLEINMVKNVLILRQICRYCISITVIGFVYSGFQAFIQAQLLVNGKQFIQHPIRYYFDFSMDQASSGYVLKRIH